MAKKVINQKASDNTYYHPDFHTALNYGIIYLHKNFGEESVREYLKQFVNSYYTVLKKDLREKGLQAVKEHYEKVYHIENAVFNMTISDDELIIHLFESPAVMHMRAGGHPVSPLYIETVSTVNEEICQNTIYDCEMVEYNNENGSYQIRFFKKQK
jgi:hypothetical protein